MFENECNCPNCREIAECSDLLERKEVPIKLNRTNKNVSIYDCAASMLWHVCRTTTLDNPDTVSEIVCKAFFEDCDGIPADDSAKATVSEVVSRYWRLLRG